MAIGFILTAIVCNSAYAYDNNPEIDSLQELLAKTKTDTTKVVLLNLLAVKSPCNNEAPGLKYARQALVLAIECGYDMGRYEADFNQGRYYEECLNNYTEALKWYQNAKEIAMVLQSDELQIKALNEMAECHEKRGEYEKALEYYTRIIEIAKDRDLKIQTIVNTGTLYQNIGEYATALDKYQSAYNLLFSDMLSSDSTGVDDSLMLMGLKQNIANVYKTMNDYDRAISSYEEITKMNKNVQYPWFDVWTCMGLGECYSYKHKHKRAIEYYSKAKGMLESGQLISRKDQYFATMYEKLGDAYLQMNRLDSALFYINLSIENALDNNSKPQLITSYITAGKIYAAQHNYNKALQLLQKSIDMTKKADAVNEECTAWLELSKVYQLTNRPASALNAYQRHVTLKDSIYSNKKIGEVTRIDMQGYFDRQQLTDSLNRAKERAEEDFKLQRQRILSYSGLGIICLLLVFSYYIFKNYRRERKANKIISEARDTIREEQKISESLLHNILPEEVAKELKEKGSTTATYYDQVTVMFTDFVNFTEAGERMTSQELVDELHTCFKAFDEIIDKYNIEKIKTIGDAYLAVSGLPVPDENHAEKMLSAALEIRDYMLQHRLEYKDRTFEVRIGLHSGDVVAGVVGVKKFAYDIWGDTVNTAARMEQSSAPGKVNISDTTYELVKDKFTCSYRGELPVKNKGNMKMYFVS